MYKKMIWLALTVIAPLCAGCALDTTAESEPPSSVGSSEQELQVQTRATLSGAAISGSLGTAPVVALPVGGSSPPSAPVAQASVDLKPTGILKLLKDPRNIAIEVINVGSAAVSGPNYHEVRVGTLTVQGTLYARYEGALEYTIPPQGKGFILAWLGEELRSCRQYRVVIDVGHTLQPRTGGAAAYANDSIVVKTPCVLTWTTPIDEASVYGIYPAQIIGDATNNCNNVLCGGGSGSSSAVSAGDGASPVVPAYLRGKTLGEIVSSYTTGREDGYVCSHCHNDQTYPPINPVDYYPDVTEDGSAWIEKDELSTDLSRMVCTTQCKWLIFCGSVCTRPEKPWSGPKGWAQDFVALRNYKPAPLRAVFQKWINDGYQ